MENTFAYFLVHQPSGRHEQAGGGVEAAGESVFDAEGRSTRPLPLLCASALRPSRTSWAEVLNQPGNCVEPEGLTRPFAAAR